MTDFFALFGEPRHPWVDVKKLEQKYYELARRTHPDARGEQDAGFTELNDAYRTLREPKLRLRHLLELEGKAHSPQSAEIAPDLVNLFTRISSVRTHRGSLEIDGLVREVDRLLFEALDQSRELNRNWKGDSADLDEVARLYHRVSFLTRWKDFLDERRLHQV